MANVYLSERVMTGTATPNDKSNYKVTSKDLPLHCPMPAMSVWNSHPRIFIPIESATNGKAKCPYCGTEYTLVTEKFIFSNSR